MGKSPLILAALAKDAVPSLNFVSVKKHAELNGDDFDGALLTSEDGKHFVVRIAKTPKAASNQETELRALKAITKFGSLPFATLTQIASVTTRDGETVKVFNYDYGQEFRFAEVAPTSSLVGSTARAIAAIHNLPLGAVQENHFPEYSVSDILRQAAAELDRAMATGRIPAVLLNRWEQALGNENLFRFMPTVVHGSLHETAVRELDGQISTVSDWMDLQISDPARDLSWIFASASEEVSYNLMLEYQSARPNADANLRQRAKLYSELSWASWLVNSIAKNIEADIADALGELETIASEVEAGRALRLIPTSFAEMNAAAASQERTYEGFATEKQIFDAPAVDFPAAGIEPLDTRTAPINVVDSGGDERDDLF